MLTYIEKQLKTMNLSKFPILAAALQAAQGCPTCPHKRPDRNFIRAAVTRLQNDVSFIQFLRQNFKLPVTIGDITIKG